MDHTGWRTGRFLKFGEGQANPLDKVWGKFSVILNNRNLDANETEPIAAEGKCLHPALYDTLNSCLSQRCRTLPHINSTFQFHSNFSNNLVQDNIVQQSFMLPAMLQKYFVLAVVTIMPFYTDLKKMFNFC